MGFEAILLFRRISHRRKHGPTMYEGKVESGVNPEPEKKSTLQRAQEIHL